MRLASRLFSIVAVGGIVLAALGGVLLGLRLADAANEPQQRTLTIANPEGAQDASPALRSAGGFTGFEGLPALPGDAVRSGEIRDVTDEGFLVASGGGALSVAAARAGDTYRIASLERSLASGDAVVLRIDASGAVVAALLITAPVTEAAATTGAGTP